MEVHNYCEIIDYQESAKSIVVKIPILKDWINPYSTMQGGFIESAIDNAVGPLSLLSAPINLISNIFSKNSIFDFKLLY